MKISYHQAEKYLQHKVILLYGNDYNKVNFYTKKIIQLLNKDKTFSICSFDFKRVNKEPHILAEELVTISLFDDNKIIHLKGAEESLSKELQHVISQNSHYHVIITANDLSSKSALRSYCESQGVAISFYKNDDSDLKNILQEYLDIKGMKCTEQDLSVLLSYFQYNDLCIESELDKLKLYLGDENTFESSDIENCLSYIVNPNLDDVCAAVVNKNVTDLLKSTDALLKEKFSIITLLRVITKYFLKLEQVKRYINQGIEQHDAIKSLKPPIFFKQLPNFKKHIQSVSYEYINLVLKRLLEIEIICKKYDSIDETIFKHNMLLIMK